MKNKFTIIFLCSVQFLFCQKIAKVLDLGGYQITIDSDFKKHIISNDEVKEAKKYSEITMPTSFILYKGDLENNFIEIAYWISGENLPYDNKYVEQVYSSESIRESIRNDMLKNTNVKKVNFLTINSIFVIMAELNLFNETTYSYYILDNNKRINLVFKFSNNEIRKENYLKIINTLKKI